MYPNIFLIDVSPPDDGRKPKFPKSIDFQNQLLFFKQPFHRGFTHKKEKNHFLFILNIFRIFNFFDLRKKNLSFFGTKFNIGVSNFDLVTKNIKMTFFSHKKNNNERQNKKLEFFHQHFKKLNPFCPFL